LRAVAVGRTQGGLAPAPEQAEKADELGPRIAARVRQDALKEAAKRVRQHEALVQDVLPDLRSRLAAAEDAIRCREL
jgi:hypothetical protein